MRLSTICPALVVLALGLGAGVLPAAPPQSPTQDQDATPSPAETPADSPAGLDPLDSPAAPSLGDRPLGQARGLVRPSRQVTLRSPLNEPLAQVLVEESQRVEAGEVLAQLDSGEQALAVEAARLEAESEAQVRKARLTVEEAEFSLEHLTELASRDVAGSWEIRRAELELRQAEADHDLAEERAARAELDHQRQQARLARYTLTAPFDGTVHRIEADEGTLLSSEQPILSVVALDPLQAVVYVPIEEFGELRTGDRYAFEAAAPVDRRLTGELITIDPVLDPASQSFRCVFEIANPDLELPAGFTVRLVGAADDSDS